MTIALSFGTWDGFYLYRTYNTWRLCWGWVAVTFCPFDLDERFQDLKECHDEHYQNLLEAWERLAELERLMD